jgi:hypothetical protein
MLGDAHRSFELATRVILVDSGIDDAAAADAASAIRDNDLRINRTEQELRRELMAYVSRRGAAEFHTVLGFTLLLKKIERCGDHAKNILELTEGGVSLAGTAEAEMLLTERDALSGLFVRAAGLLTESEPDPVDVGDFADGINCVIADCQARIDSYLTSDRPGHEVVPLAIYSRFQRRIAANLMGVVWAWAEPEYLTNQVDDDPEDF